MTARIKVNIPMREAIVKDQRAYKDIASEYNISMQHVSRIKLQGGCQRKRIVKARLTIEQKAMIASDPRKHKDIASQYDISLGYVSVLQSKKDYWTDEYRRNRRNEKALIKKWTIQLPGDRIG